MSVSNLVTAVAYTGNGVQTSFAITFLFKSASDVAAVLKDTTTLAETAQAQPAQFSVVGTNAVFVTPPTAGQVLILYRLSARTQTTTYLTTGPFLPADHEEGLDKILLQIQENTRDIGRAIKVPIGDSIGTYLANTQLPDKLTANWALAVNATANGFTLVDLTAISGSSFITAIGNVGSAPNAAGMSVTTGTLILQPADSTRPGVVNAITQIFGGAKTFLNDLTAGAKLIVTSYLQRSSANALTAFAGGGQASALQLTVDVNRFTTVATSGDSAKLPPALAGMKVVVINDGVATMNVFPTSGEQIDALGVNAAYALTTSAKNITFICPVAGVWKSIAAGGGGGSTSPLTTKGDLWGFTTLDARVPVGTNGQVLESDSTAGPGVAWKTKDINTITSALTLTGGANLSPSATKMLQTFLVQGNAAAVLLSTTPFGGTPPPDGAVIILIGNHDTNTVEIPVNDAANGCLMDGNVILAKGQTASFMYSTTLARYVRV